MAASRPILAGDIGGTKTSLACYREHDGRLVASREANFVSADYPSLEAVLARFLEPDEDFAAAAFGVAGPVTDGRCQATNLPWVIEQGSVSAALGGIPVELANDLEAAVWGLSLLPAEAFHVLNAGQPRDGHRAVIAAGTGLGEALLVQQGSRTVVVATEGGHCDFAPTDSLQDGLLAFLRRRFGGHVSYERILSGAGLHDIYIYLQEAGVVPSSPNNMEVGEAGDPAARISYLAQERNDPLCRKALELFARIYGQEAGNLALKCLPRSGVWVAGGIAPKLLPVLAGGAFMAGFVDKGRFAPLLEQIPVSVCLDPAVPRLGAAAIALSLLE